MEPAIWCRNSQIKIKYGPHRFNSPDPALCTFDLLRTSRLRIPARLSKEVMQCLTHGGVPQDALLTIFKNQLDEEFKLLSELSQAKSTERDKGKGKQQKMDTNSAHVLERLSANALVKLYDFISRAENVPQARLRREASGLSRVLGYGDETDQTDYGYAFDDADNDLGEQSTAWAPDLVSGLPSSLAETVMAFLASGFQPWDNLVLFDKLKASLKTKIESVVVRYKVGLPMSAEGFAIPGMFTLDITSIICNCD